MEYPELFYSTQNRQIDNILRETIGTVEKRLPGRVKASYLHGSFIDGTGLETSDIDLFLVGRERFSTAEREYLQQVMQASARPGVPMVEIMALDEAALLRNGHFRIQAASRLLWGDDLRAQMPEQTLDQYLHLYASFPFVYIAPMLRNIERLTGPLAYPQATEEFYGYDQQLLPPGNEPRHNIKKWVTGVCWIATFLAGWQAGQTVTGKQASVQQYQEYIHDAWSPLIEEIYTRGNQRWHYLVPQESTERRRLRELCAQTLAFEQHYLRHYQAYLLAELHKETASKLAAVRQLSKLSLDEEGLTALRTLACDGNQELEQAVNRIIKERGLNVKRP